MANTDHHIPNVLVCSQDQATLDALLTKFNESGMKADGIALDDTEESDQQLRDYLTERDHKQCFDAIAIENTVKKNDIWYNRVRHVIHNVPACHGVIVATGDAHSLLQHVREVLLVDQAL